MQVVFWFSTSRCVLNRAVVIVDVVVTSLDQNIALVATLARLFKHQVHEIQKNSTDVSGYGDKREIEKEKKRKRE
jgi:hypothetical protein